jgi:cold shock protein
MAEIVDTPIVINEDKDDVKVGEFIGQCKWFNDRLGYGFITICNGKDKGKDIFVHHSGIMPMNSNYKTLRKGEYIQFDLMEGQNGLQAIEVRGIGGGPLMCDFVATKFVTNEKTPSTSDDNSPVQWHTVNTKKSKFPNKKTRPYVKH